MLITDFLISHLDEPENSQYRVDQLTVNFAKADTGGAIDPDDY